MCGAEVRLVGVDADRPGVLLLGGLERAEAASAGRCEDDLGAGCDLVERELLALRLVDEVLGVPGEDIRLRRGLLRARLVAGEERDDGRNRLAADRAHGSALRDGRRSDAGQVPGLGLLEDQAADVLRLALEGDPGEVDDREARVREPLRDGCDGVTHEEAVGDHELMTLTGRRREVRDVIGRGLRDVDPPADAVDLLRRQ